MSEETLFHEALAKPAAERAAFLSRTCAGQPELWAAVEALLAAHLASGNVLDRPAAPILTGEFAPSSPDEPRTLPPRPGPAASAEYPGAIIAGRYKLQQLIGEGGMGEVWMAEQSEPVRRAVALKVIKAGMDSNQVVARFEAERQALALMDHPNIARVFDGGVTENRRPFFVMELVRGTPITKYCDDHRLTIPERLELFVTVCQAIQHAHQKGVIHRDIKPSNVLVAPYDGRPMVKVIDFGIAKATGQKLTEKTMFTEIGAVIGTLQYMSPEQAEMNNQDIDTRSDIYSLGVLLYEMLTGTTPLDMALLRGAAMVAMLMAIHDDEPLKPSTRLSESGDSLPSVAAQRKLEPGKLSKLIRGDLDWITMKALEKDRTRRYETANGLAMEIQRYLADEPVMAGPPSRRYRLRKFVRRNRVPVIAAAAVLFAMLAGAGAAIWQAVRATRAESEAVAERDDKELERKRAVTAEGESKKRADELKLVSDFQAQMLGQVDPTQAGKMLSDDVRAKFEAALVKAKVSEVERAQQIAVFTDQWQRVNATDAARELIDRTILRPAVAAIDKQFADQPLVDATLRQVLAARYRTIGLYDASLPLQERALATRRRVLGDKHADAVGSIFHMVALLWEQGKLSEAELFAREALETNRSVLGEEHPDTLNAINNIGVMLFSQGKLSEAEPYLREAMVKKSRALGDDDPRTMASISNMGMLLKEQGKLSEAEPYWRMVLEKRRRVMGGEHPETLIAIDNLGVLLQAQGKLSEAELYCREALEKLRRIRCEEHPDTLISAGNLGSLKVAQGKFAEAIELLASAEPAARKAFTGDYASRFALLLMNIGKARTGLREFSAAETSLLEAHGILMQSRGPMLKDTGDCTQAVVALYKTWHAAEPTQGYDAKCTQLLSQLLAATRKALPKDSPDLAGPLAGISYSLLSLRAYADAEPLVRECLAIRDKTQPDSWKTFNAKSMLGEALLGQKKYAEAEPLLLKGYEGMTQRVDTIEPPGKVREAVERLINLYTAWHAAEPGKGYDDKAAKWKAKLEAMTATPKPLGKTP